MGSVEVTHGHILVELRFEVRRGLVTEGAVEPLAVLKDSDPLQNGGAGRGPRGTFKTMNPFAFQGAPETFHQGVVIAVAPAAHAGDDTGWASRCRRSSP